MISMIFTKYIEECLSRELEIQANLEVKIMNKQIYNPVIRMMYRGIRHKKVSEES